MDPVAVKLASSAAAPLVKRLFRPEGAGAGLVDRPVRLSALVSFKGEKRTLDEGDLRTLAAALVGRAMSGSELPFPAEETQAVVHALGAGLHALGDLDLSDVQAVELGHEKLARRLRDAAGEHAAWGLSTDAKYFLDELLTCACLHILHFFTQRSTFVASTLVEQTRRQAELVAKVDALIARTQLPEAQDAAFERDWLAYVAKKHGRLTIYGIDLAASPARWPLDAAYIQLEATGPDPDERFLDDFDRFVVAPGQFAGPVDRALAQYAGPADRALAQNDRVLLRGVAGSGKTTLVQWLAISAARTDLDESLDYLRGRIPFVLPLRTLTRNGERLPAPRDFLAASGCPLAGDQPDSWEKRVLAAGRGLLLVDGIDEIPGPERARARAWLADLIDAYPGNRWLVTSRPSAVAEEWLADEGFTELTLAPMNPAGVAAFIRRWHAAARTGGEEDGRLAEYEGQLLGAVRAKPDLGRLATNPLMCGLMCALNRDRRGYLPRGRKELYGAALSMLLTRRDRERDMAGPELREEPQLQVLQRLAYWLIRNGRTEMDRRRAETLVAGALPAVPEVAALGGAAAVFGHFLARSGLLREPVPGTVDFVHRTFQDFLGARAAVEEGDFGVLVRHAADDQWEDVIGMAVAQARPREREEFLRELLAAAAAQEGVEGIRIRLLAMACLEHAAELSPAVREEVEREATRLIPPRSTVEARALAAAGPLVLDFLPGPDEVQPDAALQVVTTASHIESERAVAFLAGYAGHPALNVRSQLALAWQRFDTDRYAEEVIARLDPEELYFTVTSQRELHALHKLGTRPRLEALGELSPVTLAAYAAAAELTHVKVGDNPLLRDTGFLRGQPVIEYVRFTGCPELTDGSGLAGLPLRGLTLDDVPRLADVPGLLATLPRLESLSLSPDRAAPLDLGELPLPELSSLNLLTAVVRGLAGLRAHAGLAVVHLGWRSSPRDAADWAELGALRQLRNLAVLLPSVEAAPEGLVLAGVESLLVVTDNDDDEDLRLDRLPALFPDLVQLVFFGPVRELDLAPLARLPALRRVSVRAGALHGTDLLPEDVEVTQQ